MRGRGGNGWTDRRSLDLCTLDDKNIPLSLFSFDSSAYSKQHVSRSKDAIEIINFILLSLIWCRRMFSFHANISTTTTAFMLVIFLLGGSFFFFLSFSRSLALSLCIRIAPTRVRVC